MKKSRWLWILVCVFICTPAGARTDRIMKLTTCNWQPYAGINLTNLGFASELLSTIFRRMGHDTRIDILPWKRAMAMTAKGKYDAVYNAYYSDERAREYAYSDPYIHSNIYLCSDKKSRLDYSGLESLRPYKIGVVMGYVNSREFDAADFIVKDKALTDLHNLKKLFGKRVDFIVIDKFVALHLVKTSPFLETGADDLVFHEPPLTSMPVHAMFSKAVDGYEDRLRAFNRELAAVLSDGTFDMLLEIYNFK